MYLFSKKEKAIVLREQGKSYAQIARALGVSKSTLSAWNIKGVPIGSSAAQRLVFSSEEGRKRGLKAKAKKRKLARQQVVDTCRALMREDGERGRRLVECALLYWCEGGKTGAHVQFTNADPDLIKVFLYLLRVAFPIHEAKLRVVMSLHGYHDEAFERAFWSKITQIPEAQFTKTFWKVNAGVRRKLGYRGCISVKYYDSLVQHALKEVARLYALKIGGVI